MKFQTAYGKSVKPKTMIDPDTKLTEDNHKKEVDINQIMRKYQKTGAIAHQNKYEGRYDDIPSLTLLEALNTVKQADTMFNELPSSVRKRVNNNPVEFLQFMQNPENEQEIYDLGLAERPPTNAEPAPQAPEPATAPTVAPRS